MGRMIAARRMQDCDTAGRLRQKLVRLSAHAAALLAERDETASDSASLMRLLTREIDDAVLPRSLALMVQGQEQARLTISNRRLAALDLADAAQTDAPQPPDSETAAQMHAERLKRLVGRGHDLSLRPLGPATGTNRGGAASCSARQLAAALLALDTERRLECVFRALRASALAWVMCRGEGETRAEGSEELVACMTGLAENHASHCQVGGKAPRCTILSLPKASRLLIAADGDGCLLVALNKADLAQAMQVWRDVYGQTDSARRA